MGLNTYNVPGPEDLIADKAPPAETDPIRHIIDRMRVEGQRRKSVNEPIRVSALHQLLRAALPSSDSKELFLHQIQEVFVAKWRVAMNGDNICFFPWPPAISAEELPKLIAEYKATLQAFRNTSASLVLCEQFHPETWDEARRTAELLGAIAEDVPPATTADIARLRDEQGTAGAKIGQLLNRLAYGQSGLSQRKKADYQKAAESFPASAIGFAQPKSLSL